MVAFTLAHNLTLRCLYLDHTSLGAIGEKSIAAGIATNKYSNLVTLTGFDLGRTLTYLGSPPQLASYSNEIALRYLAEMWRAQQAQQMQTMQRAQAQVATNDGEMVVTSVDPISTGQVHGDDTSSDTIAATNAPMVLHAIPAAASVAALNSALSLNEAAKTGTAMTDPPALAPTTAGQRSPLLDSPLFSENRQPASQPSASTVPFVSSSHFSPASEQRKRRHVSAADFDLNISHEDMLKAFSSARFCDDPATAAAAAAAANLVLQSTSCSADELFAMLDSEMSDSAALHVIDEASSEPAKEEAEPTAATDSMAQGTFTYSSFCSSPTVMQSKTFGSATLASAAGSGHTDPSHNRRRLMNPSPLLLERPVDTAAAAGCPITVPPGPPPISGENSTKKSVGAYHISTSPHDNNAGSGSGSVNGGSARAYPRVVSGSCTSSSPLEKKKEGNEGGGGGGGQPTSDEFLSWKPYFDDPSSHTLPLFVVGSRYIITSPTDWPTISLID
jgi:hypothetical protein